MRRSLHYRILGPLEVLRDGRPVDLGGPKQRTVLAVLLLEAGRVVPVDRLVHALWGDRPPSTAVATLQAYISNLRRLLRDDATGTWPIGRRAPGYVLTAAEGEIDVADFVADADAARVAVRARDWAAARAAAQRGLDRWRGPLLGDRDGEHWLQADAAALEERRAECAGNLITSLLGLDRVAEAVGQAGALAARAPLDERVCRLRMTALHRAGRSGEALAVYREHAALLADELGLEPSAALRDLQTAVLRQDPTVLAWPDPPVEQRPAAAPGLVGREAELAVIATARVAAQHGEPQWLVLTGPPGIGKSRLAREAVLEWETTGGRAIRVACPEDGGLPPWWPVRALLHAVGADADAVLTLPGGLDVDEARFAVSDRAEAVFLAAARAMPLLVLVDDIQWADSASLRFLAQLTTVQAGALLVVLGLRDGPADADVQRLLARVDSHPGGRRLPVPALTAGEVAELAAAVSGAPLGEQEARELTEKTAGNPFFVSEYARLPAAERAAGQVPAGVRTVLGRRLAALAPEVLTMLRMAAVVGDPFEAGLLRVVLDLGPDQLADHLDEAIAAGMVDVAPSSDAYLFTHWLLREEVLLGIPPVQRRRLHARVAEALGAGSGADHLDRRATHLVAALPYLDPAPVYAACRAAAREAESHWNSEAAAHWWSVALRVVCHVPALARAERDEVVNAYLTALARAGRDQQVLDVVDAELLAAGREGRTGSMGRLAGALLRTAGSWPWISYGTDPQPLLTRLTSIEPLVRSDRAAHARVLAALAVGSCYDPDSTLSDVLSARAVGLAEACADPEVLADALLARALAFCGVTTRATEVKELVARLAEVPHTQERVDEVLGHAMLCWAEMTLGDVGAAEKYLRLGAGGCDLLQLPVARAQLRWAEGTIAQWRGDFDAARATYRHAYDLHRRTELYGPGVYDNAMSTLRWNEGVRPGLDEGDHSSVPWSHVAEQVAAGRPAEADRLIGLELTGRRAVTWLTYGTLTMLAHLVADLGVARHAPELIDRLRPVSDRIATVGHVGVVGPVALALARLHHLLGDADAARRELAVAAAVADREGGTPASACCRALARQLDRS